MPSVNNSLIGAVRGEATLESGKFVSGAKKIQVESKKTEAVVKQSFGSMGSSVKGFGAALTAGLSIGLLGGIIKKSLDFATSIKDVAKQVGVTTTELQEFRYAASQVGIAQAEADKGLEKLNLTLGKAAQGSASAQKALAAVGVTMKDVESKSRTEIFAQIADQMVKQGGAAKNAAALNAVFGEGFSKLIPLLDQGGNGINQLRDAAQRLGIVLSESQIQQADVTARKLDDVRQVLAAQIAGVVADNASSIVSLAQALGQLTSAVINFLGSNPTAAVAILGAMAGSRFGLPGAAIGAIAGANIGGRISQAQEDANLDPRFRQQKFRDARARLARAQQFSAKNVKDGQVIAAERELDKQRELAKQAIAAANAPKAKTGNVPLPQFLAKDPKTGRKGRTPRAPRDRSDDVTFQFDQELRRAQIDVLRAQQSLARTSADRAEIALKLLDAERQMQEAELNDRVRRAERDFAEGKITAGALKQAKIQAEKLRAEYDSVDALQRQAIADDLAADQARDAQELSDSAYDLRLEQLELEASLAETSGQRREAELRILDLMKQQEKARLEAVIADQQSSELAKQQAQQRLSELNNIYAGRAAVVRQGTRGPMESFSAEFGDISEELENLKVQGIMGAADALTELTKGWDSFRDAALSAIQQVLQELIRLQLMKMAVSFIGGGTGGFDAAGFSSVVSGNAAALGAIPMAIPGMATGGGFRIRGIPGVDRNTLSVNGIPVARVSDMEHVNVSNDNADGFGHMGPLIGNITLPPGMTPREGRETGLAIGRALQDRLGYTVTGRKR